MNRSMAESTSSESTGRSGRRFLGLYARLLAVLPIALMFYRESVQLFCHGGATNLDLFGSPRVHAQRFNL